jgi:hypothetical protein
MTFTENKADMKPQRPDPIAFLTGRLSNESRPEAIKPAGNGGKFTLEGKAEHYPGNTVICHIDRQSAAFRELVYLQETLKAGSHARHYTFMPPDSFHMTVFGGITDPLRETERWPRGISHDATTRQVTEEFAKRLADVGAPRSHTIRVDNLFAGYSVTVSGATDEQEASLRGLRDALRDATGLHDPDHDAYVFHITLAYLVDWVDEDTAREIVEMSERLSETLRATTPTIELGVPEFCSFETMHRFDPLGYLGPDGLVSLPANDARTGAA